MVYLKLKKKVKLAKTSLKIKEGEVELIDKAKMEYNAFISEFKSALPRTEEERKQDMKELKSAISMLESFDELSYDTKPLILDAGVGIFYEKMSRRFLSFISENQLNKYDFIPVDEIKYYAFKNIKNIKDIDILPILNAMKDTKLLEDIIEINPTFHILVFKNNEPLEFTLAEKVLLTFAYEDEFLSVQKLMEHTEWKEEYANKIIENLIEKGIITIQNNKIIVENFGDVDSRRKWKNVIQNKILEEKKKEKQKRKQQVERAEKLKERLAAVEDIDIVTERDVESISEDEPNLIDFKKKPTVKKLDVRDQEKKIDINKATLKHKQDIKDKDDLIGAMEALDDVMPLRLIDKQDLDRSIIEYETINLEELIHEKILSYHEKFSLLNGGFSQFEKLKKFIEKELGKVPEDLIKSILGQLKELKLIQDSYMIGKYVFYLFSDLSLTDDEKLFIQFAIGKNLMLKEEFVKGLKWEEERVLKTMKMLQEKNILRIEKNKIIIPGIIQKV